MKRSASYMMRDVGRLARASVTTVSSIVNARGGVGPEVTWRVAEAIATLDYHRTTPGLMRALRDLALKCPQEVSAVGFHGFDWSDVFSPRLTTIVQPSYEMGKRATEMLLRVIQGPDQHLESGERNRVVLKAELRVRESTASPASGLSRLKRNSIPCNA